MARVMTASESNVSAVSIATKVLRRPTRVLSFLIRSVWAAIVLTGVCVLWLVLFIVFLPFLALASLFNWSSRSKSQGATTYEPPEVATVTDSELVFDRRNDVSKLFGCNTRNVQYRWDLFQRRLAELKVQSSDLNALDFGAGSLRDSYELSKLGFKVVSVDLDEEILRRYFESYRWASSPPTLFTKPFEELVLQTGPGFFHLAIAFDVIEHLENPADFCKHLHSLLKEQGMLFTIVPNGRSVFERYFRHTIRKQRKKGLAWKPGVPHLQFKSPTEWGAFLKNHGFKVLEHNMTIGFLVNDCWHGLIALPLRVYVCPVLAMIAYLLRVNIDVVAFEGAFTPAWLMKRVDALDQVLKQALKNRFAWNLIIAQKASATNQSSVS